MRRLLCSMALVFPCSLPMTAAAASPQDGKGTIEFFKPSADDAEPLAETSVGISVDLAELVIPGTPVQAKPVADPGRADALVRIRHEFTHGTGFRYDIEFTPFIEGELNLLDYLERKDGTPMGDVPEQLIYVEAVLATEVMKPKDPVVVQPGKVGGYRTLAIAAGVAWFLGLLVLIFAFRRKVDSSESGPGQRPVTLADRLRPLVEAARTSDLSNERRAELERVLLAHWRQRRGLLDIPAAQAVSKLRSDDEAGPLLRQLEAWLHQPEGAARADVDVSALLAPYENVAADGLNVDLPGAEASRA